MAKEAVLFSSNSARNIHIHCNRCTNSNCNHVVYYDGVEDRIFNYNNRFLFTHELLNDYTNQFTLSETAIHAYISSVKRRYLENRACRSFITQRDFTHIFVTFINLQAWGYTFSCVECGVEPEDIIADGTMLSLPRILLGILN
jgi:hypothetical protein